MKDLDRIERKKVAIRLANWTSESLFDK